jgi:transposase
MITENMNTENMNKFLKLVKYRNRNKFIIMVVDGASSHRAKDLLLPKNMEIILLPPYSPELNPSERL